LATRATQFAFARTSNDASQVRDRMRFVDRWSSILEQAGLKQVAA
jgi:hypothetical protein